MSAVAVAKAGHFGLRTAGVTLIHLGAVGTVFAAVAVSTASVEKTLAMRTGDTTALGDVVIRYVNWKEVRGPNYTAADADVEVLARDGVTVIAKLNPQKRNYDTVESMTMTEAAIRCPAWAV